MLSKLNHIGGIHGIGRVDLVENRFVGMKSRGVYETPGVTILQTAHRALESITMDREVTRLRDSLGVKFAESVYYGFWFAPEFEILQIDDRPNTANRFRRRSPKTLQRQRHRERPPLAKFSVQRTSRHLRRRRRRLRPTRRRRLHQIPGFEAKAEKHGINRRKRDR